MAFTEWETPQDFFDKLHDEFQFDIDVCACHLNKKLGKFFSPKMNGLKQEWRGVCWLNPPYDKSIGLWIKKAYEASQRGSTIVCLIQGRSTDTILWHEYIMKCSELRFIKDRLSFGKNKVFKRANISSVVAVFSPYCKGPPTTCSIDKLGNKL